MSGNIFVPESPAQKSNTGFAMVTGITADGLLLQLDEETEPGDKAFKRIISAYPDPRIGDRVYFTRESGSILVHGKVG